jgi:hypothetical protein
MSFTFNDTHTNIIAEIIDANNNWEFEQRSSQQKRSSMQSVKLKIHGKINNPSDYSRIELLAANPIDRNMSYSGSGLPFPCPSIAFDESPNYYLVPENGIISNVIFMYPNSYYTIDGKTKIPPSLFVTLHPKNGEKNIHVRLELNDLLPLRTLTYRPHHVAGPLYYSAKEQLIEIQGAEATARTYANYKIKYDIA